MSDKRKVTTDALETLGNIIESGKRDAIHIAVEPCIAGEDLYPAQHIGIIDGIATTKSSKKLGIVDPFINGFVPKGKMFWLLVFPRQITSLRHVWEHPDFEEKKDDNKPSEKEISEQWLRDWCAKNDCPRYETVMGKILDYDFDGESIHFDGQDAHAAIPPEFWMHVEKVTGQKYSNAPTYFSCSC